MQSLRSVLKKLVPLGARRAVSHLALTSSRWPPPGTVRFGSLRRLAPISRDWGFDRGQPVDRYYIERFLQEQSGWIRGRVLEIDSNAYTKRFGSDRVTQSDVLHVSDWKPTVTFVGDLTSPHDLPADTFDCVILTQTLQFIHEVGAAVETIHRILKPGGRALVTVPGISRMHGDPKDGWGYHWSLTSLSARRLFEDRFPGGSVEITGHGNVLAAVAFLHGLAAGELRPEELDAVDPEFEVLLTIVAAKKDGAR